ncbi:hypothetical protein TK45_10505 [Bowmanella sp. JS7-9]|nr:hypothetical protein TK45_10505 [Bowmanella sp. JS7-9]
MDNNADSTCYVLSAIFGAVTALALFSQPHLAFMPAIASALYWLLGRFFAYQDRLSGSKTGEAE